MGRKSEAKLAPPLPQCAATNLVRRRAPPLAAASTTSHLPHEANVEQLFSRSGNLSDLGTSTPTSLQHSRQSIGVNKKAYKPTFAESKDTYFKMYRAKKSENLWTSPARRQSARLRPAEPVLYRLSAHAVRGA
jgi:hypothetical protein